jgi:hypothetical protein
MARTLPLVLFPLDLPEAELLALRLDGELFGLESGFCPVDEIVQPVHRAIVATVGLPPRLIPEQLTAAWIWGALDRIPARAQFCVRLDARASHPTSTLLQLREVVIDPIDLIELQHIVVTAPFRTAVDLARFSPSWGASESRIVARLMSIGGFNAERVHAHLDARNKLPSKRRAHERIRGLESIYPEFTR